MVYVNVISFEVLDVKIFLVYRILSFCGSYIIILAYDVFPSQQVMFSFLCYHFTGLFLLLKNLCYNML